RGVGQLARGLAQHVSDGRRRAERRDRAELHRSDGLDDWRGSAARRRAQSRQRVQRRRSGARRSALELVMAVLPRPLLIVASLATITGVAWIVAVRSTHAIEDRDRDRLDDRLELSLAKDHL